MGILPESITPGWVSLGLVSLGLWVALGLGSPRAEMRQELGCPVPGAAAWIAPVWFLSKPRYLNRAP